MKTQKQMHYEAMKKQADKNQIFSDMVKDGMTFFELETLISKHPEKYSCFENWLPILAIKEGFETIRENGLEPCFEIGESVVYIQPNKDKINVGTACNIGLLVDFQFEYDADFSFDENLQALVEDAEEYYREENEKVTA